MSNDANGSPPSNIQLLLLGSLRCIGRGHIFDDIEESSAISRETHQQLFNTFTQYGNTVMYQIHVPDTIINSPPSEPEDIFVIADFNGCIGSSDTTHVVMLCAS